MQPGLLLGELVDRSAAGDPAYPGGDIGTEHLAGRSTWAKEW